MVELVDDDVVERVGSEPLQMFASAQRLDGGKQDIGVSLLPLSRVMTKDGTGADVSERGKRLVENLLPMSHEQYALELGSIRIEGR